MAYRGHGVEETVPDLRELKACRGTDASDRTSGRGGPAGGTCQLRGHKKKKTALFWAGQAVKES